MYYFARSGFQAARKLPSKDRRLSRPHGHSFQVEVYSKNPQILNELERVCTPLDYRNLNDFLKNPSDFNLAHALAKRLSVKELRLTSAPDRGVIINHRKMREDQENVELDIFAVTPTEKVTKEQLKLMTELFLHGEFSAAHKLINLPQTHKCSRLHGHTFGLTIFADALVHSINELEVAFNQCYDMFHHKYLNKILDNPTTEMICVWIWDYLRDRSLKPTRIQVSETRNSGCFYDGNVFKIYKKLDFEASRPMNDAEFIQMKDLPESEILERIDFTGGSYQLLLEITGRPEKEFDWVMDYSEIKKDFQVIYDRLDHNNLANLPHIKATGCGTLACWILQYAPKLIENISKVEVFCGNVGAQDDREVELKDETQSLVPDTNKPDLSLPENDLGLIELIVKDRKSPGSNSDEADFSFDTNFDFNIDQR